MTAQERAYAMFVGGPYDGEEHTLPPRDVAPWPPPYVRVGEPGSFDPSAHRNLSTYYLMVTGPDRRPVRDTAGRYRYEIGGKPACAST